MATNKPGSRQTHITRVFGTNRSGDILSDIFVDLERMEIVKSAHQVPPELQWQGLQRRFRWSDDPSADDYNEDGTPSRILETVKVCDPETQDPDDPDEWVPVLSIKGLKSRVETGIEENGGSAMSRFLASVTQQELQTARKIEVRKIVRCDTNIDDDAQAAADAGLKQYVVPSEQYEKDLSTKDDTQFVDHEIILYLKGSGNHADVSGQGGQTRLLNQYLIDESDDLDGSVVGSAGYNPPYRLDPFQNIVNVNWGVSIIVAFIDVDDIGFATTTFNPIGRKVKLLLSSFVLPLSSGGSTVLSASFYKVSANAGEFMQTIAPSVGGGFDGTAGHSFWALAFAITGSIDDSLARAKTGADLAIQAISSEYSGLGLGRADPPGLLWSVGLNHIPADHSLTWKARYDNHRNDNLPFNKMVQVYPLSDGWDLTVPGAEHPVISYSGYTMRVYRLDKKGTGQSYGTANPDASVTGNSIDPIWHQPISSGGLDDNQNHGIPFGDPPPLIIVDVPNAGDHS